MKGAVEDVPPPSWSGLTARGPAPSQEGLLASVALDIQAMAQHRQNPLGDFKPRGSAGERRMLDQVRTALGEA